MKKRICLVIFTSIIFFTTSYAVLNTKIYGAVEPQRIPVLLYHHILSDEENKLFRDNAVVLALDKFELQMKYLYDNGYRTLTDKELIGFLYDGLEVPRKSVAIHFDDGYYSGITRACDVLKEYGFNATVFLITSFSEGPQKRFEPDGLQYISVETLDSARGVFSFQSHTHDMHDSAGGKTKFVTAPPDEILADLQRSFAITGACEAFAYPLGQHASESAGILKVAGVKIAFTTKYGYVSAGDDPYLLNRRTIYRDTTMEDFIYYLNAAEAPARPRPNKKQVKLEPQTSDSNKPLISPFRFVSQTIVN